MNHKDQIVQNRIDLAERNEEYWRDRAGRLQREIEALRGALTAAQGTLAWTQTALEGVCAERDALAAEVIRATKNRLAPQRTPRTWQDGKITLVDLPLTNVVGIERKPLKAPA